ncbi:MAG TPA: ABC transporter ATP-binding protein [Stellaceae bacterium]|nr:ABC transporter ATP-binding protein [Stellaceae bacterium]
MTALLDIEDLRVSFGAAEALKGVSFSLGRRERLALVGGSGAGKSLIGRSILRLLPPGADLAARRLAFDGNDLLRAGPRELRALRGRRIGWVLQDPKFSLNPVMRVGAQIEESLRLHHALAAAETRERAVELLAAVRLPNPTRVHGLYPHELSGGMGQRAMIAMMLAGDPDLLIADEPTSALDATAAIQILALLDELVERRGMGLLFISHDLRLVEGFCESVLVLEAGVIVERCEAASLGAARHPYTRRLMAARPMPFEAP